MFEQENCDRCYSDLVGRTMSWFNQDTICIECSVWEDVIIDSCEKSKSDLEGIGYIPDVDFDIDWGEKPPEELV